MCVCAMKYTVNMVIPVWGAGRHGGAGGLGVRLLATLGGADPHGFPRGCASMYLTFYPPPPSTYQP